MAKERSPSLGMRLVAALMSYQMGYAGVDRLLARMEGSGRPVKKKWEDKAMELLRDLMEDTDVKPVNFKSTTNRVQ